MAAARSPAQVSAVVSRERRPDLAGPALAQVRAATLLIVGGSAFNSIGVEPGALEEVSRWAQEWFQRHLGRQNTNAA